jgi:flagellar biosynthesis protein FlgN
MQSSDKNPAGSLGEELKAGNTLLLLLKQEQEFLINADVDGLTKLTEEKTKTVALMTTLAQGRHRMLGNAGFEASEAGMQTWLKTVAPATANAWKELLGLAQQAKEINRTNGLLIGQHMARNQSALNVLQGSPQSGNLYGPNGQATGQSGRRSLVVG